MAALLLFAGIATSYSATWSETMRLQNSDLDDAFLYQVAAHSHDGRRAVYVTRSFDDKPDHGIHLFQPKYLLERGDRWVGIHHFETDQPKRSGETVYYVAGIRCYAHRRGGKKSASTQWKHPACIDFCQRHACTPVLERALDNVGERAFNWYPGPSALPKFEVGIYAVDTARATRQDAL